MTSPNASSKVGASPPADPKGTVGYAPAAGGNATVGYASVSSSAVVPPAGSGTVGFSGAPSPASSLGLDATIAHSHGETATSATVAVSAQGMGSPSASLVSTRNPGRTTVLPRRSGTPTGPMPEFTPAGEPRYHKLQVLGEGGAGEVSLELDQDIQRKVAVKRLRPEVRTAEGLLRFAEEVRVVGQLEHPSIVPVHDVGIDEEGHHYLVMKYVKGETLEAIIEKLREGDTKYLERFTIEARARIFLSVLQAMRYAHEHGIIHRDLKPANIMVGPYGEVTVMDWGLAKKIEKGAREPEAGKAAEDAGVLHSDKLLQTQHGAILGTPLYMSPEQAAGRTATLDERSDVYSLSMIFFEMLTLEHPLATKKTVHEVLAAVMTQEWTRDAVKAHCMKVNVPAQYMYYLMPGLKLKPEDRYPTVNTMEHALQSILDGSIEVQCAITMGKNMMHRTDRWMDQHPYLFMAAAPVLACFTVVGMATAVWAVLHAVH